MSDCIDPKVITHETIWQPEQCVDGGVLRAKRTYTNLAASGFNTAVGYSGHYYGARKYTGLIPQSAYFINLEGQTGEGGFLDVPREIYEWEYGSNNRVDYSGVKIANPSGQSNQFFGKSISVSKNHMAVGMPFYSFYDTEGYLLDKAGTIFIYERDPEPSGSDWSNQYDKAPWHLSQQIVLPSAILRDYIYEKFKSKTLSNLNVTLPFEVEKTSWKVGQNGRQLGYSLDLCSITDEVSLGEKEKNILVTSGPGCKFDRQFQELASSGVSVVFFILTDSFEPSTTINYGPPIGRITYDYNYVDYRLKDLDLLFRYFADPPTKFNIKINILQCLPDSFTGTTLDFPEPKPDFVTKVNSRRHEGIKRGSKFEARDDDIFESLKNQFFASFPYDPTKLNNNIPAILGFYIDNTPSFGGRRAVTPALDRFIEFYKSYSLASGLKTIDGVPATGYTFQYLGENDIWSIEAASVLKETLDLDKLRSENVFPLFANSIGSVNSSATELNEIPYSGGCVYIFEKESGVWNLIQNIESPTKLNNVHPDRFGHCVRISDDGDLIVIGSPYLGSNNVMTYEYDNKEKTRLYNNIEPWLAHRASIEIGSDHYNILLNKLQQYKQQFTNNLFAVQKLYLELSPTDKFKLRNDKDYWGDSPIQEYKQAFTYSNKINDGGWGFLLGEVAPCPRLGYSVAVNEDGSIIAAGSPTDSFNEYDEYSSYFAPNRPAYTTWPAYVNAGSVRVFESRKYYPHNLVVNYGKFGNLQYELSTPEDKNQYFNHFKAIYESAGLQFLETNFVTTEIPEEAGLLFIITPAVDALSDEILNNIKTWLSLGDRHLVLVGNDPVWESNGAYLSSNNIINKLLRKLNSGLVLTAARNQYESLPSFDINKPNIIPSYVPTNALEVISVKPTLFGSGVADIKPYFPNAERSYECDNSADKLSFTSMFNLIFGDLSYKSCNDKCEIPIKHLGDMRSQWNEICLDTRGKPKPYPVNWPLVIGAVTPSTYGCGATDTVSDTNISSNTTKYNFAPILVAAEHPEEYDIIVSGSPISSGLVEIGEELVDRKLDIKFEFDTIADSGIAFIWTAESGNYTYLNTNINEIISKSRFYDPDPYNDKDAILQAKSVQIENNTNIGKNVSEKAHFMVEEAYQNTTSKIILMAGTHTEEKSVLDSFGNIYVNFYINLFQQGLDSDREINGSFIAQLGDWTGRESLKDLNPDSVLDDYLNRIFSDIDMNVSMDELLAGSFRPNRDRAQYDICWIAEPTSLPTEDELMKLQSWLRRGNKKIIITYQNSDVASINRIIELCKLLEVSMKPLFLPEKFKYADKRDIPDYGGLALNFNHPISRGIVGSIRNTIVYDLPAPNNFIPIELNNASPIVFIDGPVVDDYVIDTAPWELDSGITNIQFPFIPGSGYKLFVTSTSEHSSEKVDLHFNISSASTSPVTNYPNTTQPVIFRSLNLSVTPSFFNGTIQHDTIDFFPDPEQNSISIDIYTNKEEIDKPLKFPNSLVSPKTTRIVSISGCLLPIIESIGIVEIYQPVSGWVTYDATPDKIVTITPPARPISTDNSKYCPTENCIPLLGNKLIADGPIVVAQEMERFSSFDYGVSRSRITVISDSNLIQGKTIADENGVRNSLINFLIGLYPYTNFPSLNKGRSFTDFVTKIQSPEISSPAILFNSTQGNIGTNLRFLASGVGIPSSGRSLSHFIASFDRNGFKHHGKVEDHKSMQYLEKVDNPKTDPQIAMEKSGLLSGFKSYTSTLGSYSKFAGYINDKYYEDAKLGGGIPDIMKDTGHDYLDFDYFPSGYPGNLFGYSIDIWKNKLLIGSPFSCYDKENISSWQQVLSNTPFNSPASGSVVGFNGGAGSVYLYERIPGKSGITQFGNLSRWSLTRKFRPDSINIGQDTNNLNNFSSPEIFGDHNYKSDDLSLSIMNDQFGHSVQIYSDMIAIGAPGHDFDNYVETIFDSGAFIKKEFDSSIDIPKRIIYDLGSSGNRSILANSGIPVLNNGAIFTYENRITYWQDKTQEWKLIQKIVPQGYNSRKQKSYLGSLEIPSSGSENDRFGSLISLDRAKRTDSDYTLGVGVPQHKFSNSGDPIVDMGAVYIFDGMLRKMPPSKIDPDSFIHAKIFGETINNSPFVAINFYNSGSNISHVATGIVYSNEQGEIFLEASGQDIVDKLYIKHRPYIKSVYGKYAFGEQSDGKLNVFIEGKPNNNSGIINLTMKASDSDIVYNNVGLYQAGILGFASGIPSGLSLYLYSPEGIEISGSTLMLHTSGVGISPDSLNLRVRGK